MSDVFYVFHASPSHIFIVNKKIKEHKHVGIRFHDLHHKWSNGKKKFFTLEDRSLKRSFGIWQQTIMEVVS